MSNFLLSVCLITYNQKKFITDAIESVLMQKTNFKFQLVIADDCSTDGSREILLHFKEKYPDIIELILQEKNVGPARNWLDLLKYPKSKYIAYFEGDDYWIDSLKLQKQVDFMEQNDGFSMCFHAVEIKMASEKDFYEYLPPPSDVLTLSDIIREHYIPSCSLMFRNTYFLDGYPDWLSTTISGDIPHEILLASKGKTKYFEEKMACYRRNSSSVTQVSGLSKRIRVGYIDMYTKLAKELSFPYSLMLYQKVVIIYLSMFKTKILQLVGRTTK